MSSKLVKSLIFFLFTFLDTFEMFSQICLAFNESEWEFTQVWLSKCQLHKWFLGFSVIFNLIYLETFPSLPKNVFLSCSLTVRYKEKIALLKTVKIIIDRGKNSPEFKHRVRTVHIEYQTRCLPVHCQRSWRSVKNSFGSSFSGKQSGKILGSSKF